MAVSGQSIGECIDFCSYSLYFIILTSSSAPFSRFKSPDKIRNKLDFDSLIVTLSGTSNLSACTVHAYKRYSAGDLLVGFDFAPIVYFNPEVDSLEVDKSLIHDVKEQSMGKGEDVKKNKRTSTCAKESFYETE